MFCCSQCIAGRTTLPNEAPFYSASFDVVVPNRINQLTKKANQFRVVLNVNDHTKGNGILQNDLIRKSSRPSKNYIIPNRTALWHFIDAD